MDKYIFAIGKPYPQPEALSAIRRLGYKAGLFLDKNVNSKRSGDYDKVVELDFSSFDTLAATLPNESLKVAGLICSYENYLLAKSWLGQHFDVGAPSLEAAKACTDKYLMRQAFMNKNSRITPNFGVATNEDEVIAVARSMSYPLIVKPTNLVKSLLVMRCDNEAELIKNFAYAKQQINDLYRKHHIYGRKPGLVIEEFITGKLCSVAAFVDHNGTPHFCEGIASLVNAQDKEVDDNYLYARHLPAHFDTELEQEIFRVAAEGIEALGMTSTPAHVELIYNENGVKLIEIGARIGGYRPRMYQASYGIDLIGQEIKLALKEEPNLQGKFQSYSSVFEIFPPAEGEFVELVGADRAAEYSYFSVKAKPGQTVGLAKNGHKAAAVIIINSTDKNRHDELCRSVDDIRVTIRS